MVYLTRAFAWFFIATLVLFSCKSEDERKLLPELYGDWVPVETTYTQKQATSSPPPPRLYSIEPGFTFDSTGTVDIKRGYFNISPYKEHLKRKTIFLGSKTKYHFLGDSLKIFNLEDSVWTSLKIAKLTDDSLSFELSPGKRWNFVRKVYNLEAEPTFDKIVVSTSGCYGTCQISNTIISSN